MCICFHPFGRPRACSCGDHINMRSLFTEASNNESKQWTKSTSSLRSHDDNWKKKLIIQSCRYLRIVLIKIDRESTSFAETFLICITHLSELCADAKGKAERLFSVGFASKDLLWHSEIRGLSFSLLLLYSGNFHGSFGKIEDCSENGSHFTSVLFSLELYSYLTVT